MIGYKKRLVEVDEVLDHLSEENLSKIPLEIRQAIKENKDKNYVWKYDETKELKDQGLSKDTIAIKIASVTADGKTSTINCHENAGSFGTGKWDGSSPYTLLMVATSIPFAFNNRTTGVVTKIAAKEFGTFGKNFGNIINTTIASRPMASVGISIVVITFA